MEKIIKEILNKENIEFKTIKKASSGFTNLVYFVDEKFVIKMSNDTKIKEKLDKETSIYKNIKLQNIPTYISSGNYEDYQYLIISKLQGNSLYSIWHTLSKDERKNCITQIAGILKNFNSQNYDFLNKDYMNFDWQNYISNELKDKSLKLLEMGYNINNLDSFINNELPDLFDENVFCLVYNDAHFDNFIYDSKKLYLIDFDRVRVCPIDYEMLIFKTMCDNPSKFASEEDEDKIIDEDYIGIYDQFKKEYPEMFKNPKVEDRIKVYQFNYLIGQAIDIKNNEWIKELLNTYIDKKEVLK